ncbi:Intradiol ring-cleavage dioxygenase [Talaromyces proteolyticus]|uniref:Intradiol ring-cleavage dioxygenase n=1 Tax=Talaromyces proteolyticus TaxID=1131652 RepID=A0AAD4PTZ7_9EURO|nr:Intradiol ring-cleavage dioxygenase [Talaromyces proteolyticus]KAH8688727.1 Intradiol ring-cleavage dioxygenase [Talaromyces proteolyticus]
MFQKRIVVRDLGPVLIKCHEVTEWSITVDTPESGIFSDNTTFVLNPEDENWALYVKSEYFRSNIDESQVDVALTPDAQFLDVETCKPITSIWFDLWNCSPTGVHSGADGQGNEIQETNDYHMIQFKTIVPSNHSGRTTYHRVVTHIGDLSQLSNNTISGGTVAHIGQLLWDQDLIHDIEAISPYNTNDTTIITTSTDCAFDDEIENAKSDPIINYIKVGDTIEDGQSISFSRTTAYGTHGYLEHLCNPYKMALFKILISQQNYMRIIVQNLVYYLHNSKRIYD